MVSTMAFLFVVAAVLGQAPKTASTQTKETKKEVKTKMLPLKKLEGKAVGAEAKNNFITDFGNIPNVKWERSANFDEATFLKDGKEMKAYYDFPGKLVGTTSVKKITDLPAKAQSEIKSKYKDYSIGPVIFFDDNELNDTDMSLWNTQFEDQDNYFVELAKGTHKIIVQVHTTGDINLFTELSK
jgi:hypothetical protein